MSQVVTSAGVNYTLPDTGDEDWGDAVTAFLVALANNSSTGITLAAVGSAPNPNGASLSGTTLNLQPASATEPGVVSTGTQSFEGNKTVVGTIAATNLTGTNTGDLTLGGFGAAPNPGGLSLASQVLQMEPANATNPGGVSTGAQTIAGVKTFNSSPVLATASHVRATSASGQSIPNNTPTTVVFGTSVYDTQSEYNATTGQFTAKEAGYYHVTAGCVLTSDTPQVGDRVIINLYINASLNTVGRICVAEVATPQSLNSQISTTVHLAANDVVTINMGQVDGATNPRTLISNAADNFFSVDRFY